jgi:hypothetical protein
MPLHGIQSKTSQVHNRFKMATDYSDLGYNQEMVKEPIGTSDGSISTLEADSQFGDGSLPGMKLSSGPDIASFGFADNFDSSYPFILPYYIDSSSKVVRATISLFFQPFRAYETAASSGGSTTPTSSSEGSGHTHTVSDHTHTVTGATTSSEGTGESAHQHTILTKATSSTNATLAALGYRYVMVQPSSGGSAGPCDDDSDIGLLWAANPSGDSGSDNDVSHKTNCTISGHNHTVTGQTANSGGGQTSSNGSVSHSHTVTVPAHTHGITYGIYSSGYPTGVEITIDGVNVTTALGGPWNPSALDASEVDMDITQYTGSSGSHTIQLTTTGQGRCIPMLIIKSVIGSKS